MRPYVKFYDFIVHHTNELGLLKNIASTLPENPKILELGAGTGRLTIPLAEGGYNIHAIDNDKQMLETFQEKLKNKSSETVNNIYIEEADFLSCEFLENHYDFIFFSSNTFLLVANENHQQKLLHKIYKALKPAGILYIEFFNPSAFFEQINQRVQIHLYTKKNPATKLETAHFVSYLHNPLEQLLISYNFLEEFPVDAASQRYSFKEKIRYMNLPEMRFRLLSAGFNQTDFYAGYELDPIQISSLKIISLSKKE